MTDNQFQDNEKNPTTDQAKWWESSEDHRFALEVLQLPQRRRILRFLAGGSKTREEIEAEFRLNSTQAEYQLSMLEKALVVERAQSGFKATQTGMLYLERVDVK